MGIMRQAIFRYKRFLSGAVRISLSITALSVAIFSVSSVGILLFTFYCAESFFIGLAGTLFIYHKEGVINVEHL
jgi:hypothetical protein